ncbi:hypothetical protein WR25_05404 [Diploscapter pachys]|uniref:Uncharacterized protein n=1 Tax=Diploscapter pachys TaxID=2018661 RepID=A0A2A2KA31_9BILA|nr:hypothetical protein WR25_05404 [Diploscapter pachys]
MEIWMWDAGRQSEKERKKERKEERNEKRKERKKGKKEGRKKERKKDGRPQDDCPYPCACPVPGASRYKRRPPHGIQNELTEETDERKDGRNSFSSDERLLRNPRARETEKSRKWKHPHVDTRSLLYQLYIF